LGGGFETGRLKLILDACSLSQVHLARILNVSPGTVSKWVSGGMAPKPDMLEKLAKLVGVESEWFARPTLEPLTSPMFRSMASAHKTARVMLKARLELAQELALIFSEFVDYPSVNLPTRHFKTLDAITDEDIESAAAECRKLWRLGRTAIQDLMLAVEGAGVIVVREETGAPAIEGLSASSKVLEHPMVLLSADKGNGYRSRFDLAHEIGHIVLHFGLEQTTNHQHHKQMEQQAHRFAGALLLPKEQFASELNAMYATLNEMLHIKCRWGVSVRAIIMRLKDLELLDDWKASELFRSIAARWKSKWEPHDEDRKPERPRLLRRTVEMLVENNVMPLDAIPRCAGLSAANVEALAGLPNGYLCNGGNIIPFVRLREG